MKRLVIAAAVVAGAASALVAADAQRTERIRFEPGRSEGIVRGKIHGYETVLYRIGAGAGQQMRVQLETQHSATHFNLFAPGTEPGRDAALHIGEIAGNRFEGRLAAPGDYVVQVYMMRSAARREENAEFTLAVHIGGTADPAAKAPAPGPWPVDTDASGDFRCGERFELSCPFRVKRNPHGATVWVVRPGEARDPASLQSAELRTLYFEVPGENPQFSTEVEFSTSGDEKVEWKREGDNWIVTIGSTERYRIVDAALWGG